MDQVASAGERPAVATPSRGAATLSVVLSIAGAGLAAYALFLAMGWAPGDLLGADDTAWTAARSSSMNIFIFFAIGAGLSLIGAIIGMKTRLLSAGKAGMIIGLVGVVLSIVSIALYTDAVTFGL